VGAHWPGTLALAWAKRGGAARDSDDEHCCTTADRFKCESMLQITQGRAS